MYRKIGISLAELDKYSRQITEMYEKVFRNEILQPSDELIIGEIVGIFLIIKRNFAWRTRQLINKFINLCKIRNLGHNRVILKEISILFAEIYASVKEEKRSLEYS